MAQRLTLPKLILYADELCGTYGVHPGTKNGFITRDAPLASIGRLSHYMNSLGRVAGIEKARRALRYAADGSASPAESKLHMCVCAPRLLGGAGLPAAVMNYEVKLSPTASKMAGKRLYRCDLAWPDHCVALEYDSRQYHSDDDQITSDSIRKNILEYSGMKIVVAKRSHLYTYDGFHDLELLLARALGVRIRTLTEAQRAARIAFRKELFAV